MKKVLEVISEEVKKAFAQAGYDEALGKVTISNRPDLCEYQCNGAMAGAKQYHKAPIMIANDVADCLQESKIFSEVTAVAPGFLNMKIKEDFLISYLSEMQKEDKFGQEESGKGKKIVSPVVFQGGVSKNEGVVEAFKKALGCDILVDENGHLMGAFGIAILAGKSNDRRKFDFSVGDMIFRTQEINCGRCPNNCEIICVYRDNVLIDSWGNRCDKGSLKQKQAMSCPLVRNRTCIIQYDFVLL